MKTQFNVPKIAVTGLTHFEKHCDNLLFRIQSYISTRTTLGSSLSLLRFIGEWLFLGHHPNPSSGKSVFFFNLLKPFLFEHSEGKSHFSLQK